MKSFYLNFSNPGGESMTFQIAYHTDAGIKKKTNQDALLMKTAKTAKGKIGLFIVCDGMGGLSYGEMASATVIKGMSDWFDNVLPEIYFSEEMLSSNLADCVKMLNEKIIEYGEASKLKLGTTITALLIVNSKYYLVQVGDSRAYRIGKQLTLLTEDQTLVARELARGNITEEQARKDPRRNILLQCVGATPELSVVISEGEVKNGEVYLLCTDGFYHEITEDEIFEKLRPDTFTNENEMKKTVVQLVELVKERKEVDNISLLVTKVT